MISRVRKNSTYILYRVFHSINTALNNPGVARAELAGILNAMGLPRQLKTNYGQNMDRKAHAGYKSCNT